MSSDAIVQLLVGTGKWSAEAVRMGLRSGFRCEYCDADLLASVDAYKSWQLDHIVPTSAGGPDEFSNWAVSCHTCNFCLKRKWDPRSSVGEADRGGLILAVRKYVYRERTRILAELADIRSSLVRLGA